MTIQIMEFALSLYQFEDRFHRSTMLFIKNVNKQLHPFPSVLKTGKAKCGAKKEMSCA
ncbi:hypothetical protein H3S89_01585 [Bartonella sp. B10834G6]|nr:hypothetical protein [Bartonella apis]